MKKRCFILCLSCIGAALLIGIGVMLHRNWKYPFAGEEVKDAWMVGTMNTYMFRHYERNMLSDILQDMEYEKAGVDAASGIEFREMVLHSSRRFLIETNKAEYELILYGKVGTFFVCEIDKERYLISEETYQELELLYDTCFRNAHQELFQGFRSTDILRITYGIGIKERELSEEERKNVTLVLQTMNIIGIAEENPTELYFGAMPLTIETETDTIVICEVDYAGEESVICSFNGSQYRIDKESGERLSKMFSQLNMLLEE